MDNPVATFTDKSNRQITIGGDGSDIVAEHNGNVIGRFVFDNNGNDFFAHADIDSKYQRKGIGTQMIMLAEDWYGAFNIIDHLSMEGAAFINYCISNSILKKTHEKTSDDRY